MFVAAAWFLSVSNVYHVKMDKAMILKDVNISMALMNQ